MPTQPPNPQAMDFKIVEIFREEYALSQNEKNIGEAICPAGYALWYLIWLLRGGNTTLKALPLLFSPHFQITVSNNAVVSMLAPKSMRPSAKPRLGLPGIRSLSI